MGNNLMEFTRLQELRKILVTSALMVAFTPRTGRSFASLSMERMTEA